MILRAWQRFLCLWLGHNWVTREPDGENGTIGVWSSARVSTKPGEDGYVQEIECVTCGRREKV